MMGRKRDHRRRAKSFSLPSEQGAMHFHFAPDPIIELDLMIVSTVLVLKGQL
jgi:hypothetical protein